MPDPARNSAEPSERTLAFREIPSVAALLSDPTIRDSTSLSPDALAAFVRARLAEERRAIEAGRTRTSEQIRAALVDSLRALERPKLMRSLNATGIVVHTNLGRAPVSVAAAAAMAQVAGGNVALEIEAESGRRGGRMREIAVLMRVIAGAEDTLVVNNNAAAVLLTLAALAAPGEVILSRGEAVEIGGGFRIPDVLRQSGARLVEVGTTNRTYPRDYAAAVTAETTALLKVHPSNFRLTGFVRSTSTGELAQVALTHGLPLIEDLGSGALLDTTEFGLAPEPTIQATLTAGASIVTASGDKLLGGPQAGLICGRADLVQRIAEHPLARAVRADKTCLAGLSATLRHYARGEAVEEIPVWRMIAAPRQHLLDRADVLVARLNEHGVSAQAVPTTAAVGGGSLPGETLPSVALRIESGVLWGDAASAERLARTLRLGSPPVFGRLEGDALLLDLRTVLPEDDEALVEAIVAAVLTSDAAGGAPR